MENINLKTFIAVVEENSITKAAEKLNRVPSGITARIQQLEKELGTPLFLRKNKQLFLTPKGHLLLDYARKIIALTEEAQRKVQSTIPGGKFRIGAMESAAAMRLPLPLSIYHQQYPQVDIELCTGPSHDLLDKLFANKTDAIFVADTPSNEHLGKITVFTEELVLVIPKGAEKKDLRNQSLLAFKKGCSYRKRAEQWYKECGTTPRYIVDMASYHAILGGVAAGMGVAVLPQNIINSLCMGANTVSLQKLPARHSIVSTEMVWRKGIESPNLEALRAILEETSTTLSKI